MADAIRIVHGNFGRAVLVRTSQSMAQHAHRTCQLLFNVDGQDVNVMVGSGSCRLTSESVVLLNAWEPHSLHLVPDSPLVTLLGLHLEPGWLRAHDASLALSMHPKFFKTPCGTVPSGVSESVRNLADLIALENKPDSMEVEQRILEIVIAVTGRYSDTADLSGYEVAGGMKCDSRIRGVLATLRESVGKKIAFDELATATGMSRPHFFLLFKRETRLTPMAYVNMIRMDAAFKQIAETRCSLLDIALDLGFDSPGNFTRFFNKQNGISPSQYRRSLTFL